MRKKYPLLLILTTFLFVTCLSLISAWTFNGTIYDIDGKILYNATINVTYWTMGASGPSLVGSNFTFSNESGWFNVSVTENVSYFYKPVIKHFINNKTDGSTALDYVGQILPIFPYRDFVNLSDINFYLRPAGTINITAVNSSGGRINFNYMVKDTLLGYDVASNWQTPVSEANIYLPRDRNYSIMIYPSQKLPVSFNWNNFSSSISYNITSSNLSQYINTSYTLNYKFNCTEQMVRIDGYINRSGITGWDEFTVIPYLLEPGDMIYFDQGNLPWNMSSWMGQSDLYNLSKNGLGYYNISLPAPVESANYILFATARNGSGFYGGYKNISLTYGDGPSQYNFTMYPLMGTNGASANGNLSVNDASSWAQVNVSSQQKGINLVHSNGSIISGLTAHLEITVDYSNYGAKEFTFMKDISSGSATFYLPLINDTGIKEMNIYSMNYAPKSISLISASGLLSNPNFTLSSFSPGDIDDTLSDSQISITIYKSNSTCDVPNPPSSCIIVSSSDLGSFNPLRAIIGGGAISFRMGTGNIVVHYVNVDMLASGPPDGLFENDAGTSESSDSFSNVVKFGSTGPKIYDYVLISVPYSESAGSGLNDSAAVSMSIRTFYGENDNGVMNWTAPIWTSSNGTNASNLAGNYSHYSARQSEWQTLMSGSTCVSTTTGTSALSSSSPCAINTVDNKIWIRLPHFSGTAPSISGSIIPTSTDSSSSSGGSIATTTIWKNTHIVTAEQFEKGFTKRLSVKERFKFEVGGENHYVGVKELTKINATIEIASEPIEVTLGIGEDAKADVDDDGYYDVYVKLNNILHRMKTL